MAKKRTRSLIIDASVAKAAGLDSATHVTAQRCRDFLKTVSVIGHRMAVSAAIDREWNKHQSSFARRWRRSMFAKKLVEQLNVPADEPLRQRIETVEDTDKHKTKMLEDVHLIEAALKAEQRVVSLDEEVRDLFRKAASAVTPLRKIVWVNPDKEEEQPLEWLHQGAPADLFRRLNHRTEVE